MLLDSNLLIDVLCGEAVALQWLESQPSNLAISVISWMELLVGCKPNELDVKLPDAIILATARIHGRVLATRNTRDFPESLEGVLMPYAI